MTLYTLLFLAGLLVGMLVCEWGSGNPSVARKTYLAGVVGGVLGARLWYAAQYGLSNAAGFSYYGFGIGAALAVAAFHRRLHGRWAETDFLDAVAPALALGSSIHRLGCFYSGCCFGKVCRLPWAVVYPPGSHAYSKQLAVGQIEPGAASSLPVHPTQLYGSVTGIIVFGVLMWLVRANPFPRLRYELFLGVVLFYSGYRFLMEFLRDDAGGRHLAWLTFSQLTSVAVFVLAGALILQRRLRFRRGDRSLLASS